MPRSKRSRSEKVFSLTLPVLSGQKFTCQEKVEEIWGKQQALESASDWGRDPLRRHEEVLALVRRHPASEWETKERAERCLAHYQTRLPADLFAGATRSDQPGNLETIVALVQTELARPLPANETGPPAAALTSRQAAQAELVEPLTGRELEVLGLIAAGLTNQHIADELIISVGTVKFYTSQIYGKLAVNSRTQAVARARELGILT